MKSSTNSPRFRRNVGKVLPNYTLSRPRRQCFHRYRHENLRYLFCQRNLNLEIKTMRTAQLWTQPTRCNYIGLFIIPSQLYMFRAIFSPIIRSTWLYLQHLVIYTNVVAGWCHGWVGTAVPTLHVSGDVFAHHQEHLTVFTAPGNIHQCRCRLVSWMSWNCNSNSTCFGRCFRPLSGALNCIYSTW